jgi:hypothetical protein
MSNQRPPRPSLEYLKKQAKALLKAHQHADPEIIGRIRASHPRLHRIDVSDVFGTEFSLQDAQLTIAREHDFPSWPKLIETFTSSNVDQLRPLKDLHTEFVKKLSGRLTQRPETVSVYRLGSPVVDVDISFIDQVPYRKYLRSRPNPCWAYCFTPSPLRGAAILDIPKSLADLLMPEVSSRYCRIAGSEEVANLTPKYQEQEKRLIASIAQDLCSVPQKLDRWLSETLRQLAA